MAQPVYEIDYFRDFDSESDECTADCDGHEHSSVEQVPREKRIDLAEYANCIQNILHDFAEVNCSNALELNMHMQRRLMEVRRHLVALREDIKRRYNRNTDLLKSLLKRNGEIGSSGAYLKGGTFHFKGNLFFRDQKYRTAPNNPDYYQRSKLGEMFPMDFDLRSRHTWTMVDKVGIVHGIKEQLIDYIRQRENRLLDKKDKHDKILMMNELHSHKLVDLLQEVDDNFIIDWNEISMLNLRYRHTPTSCKAMWDVYLKPSLNRGAWTDEEKCRLLDAVKLYKSQNWQAIATMVGKRSDYQCFVQYQTTTYELEPKRWSNWTHHDNQRLLELVKKHTVNGVIDWTFICPHFPHRPKAALISRYTYSLHPEVSHKPFRPEEDLLLLAAVQQYGTQFACIPRTLFPNRSVIQLRSRYYNTLQNRDKHTGWSLQDDEKLMNFVAKNGTSAWLHCSQALGNHTRMSCRTRFLTIKKFFEKKPNATLADLPRRNKFPTETITPNNWQQKIVELRENPSVDLKPRGRRKHRHQNKDGSQNCPQEKASIADEEHQVKTEAACVQQETEEPPVKKKRSVSPNSIESPDTSLAYDYQLDEKAEIMSKVIMSRCPQKTLNRVASALSVDLPRDPKSYMYDRYITQQAKKRIFLANAQPPADKRSDKRELNLQPGIPQLMSLRAQQLAMADVPDEGDPVAQLQLNENPHIRLFRKRFSAIFKQTASLINVNPDELDSNVLQSIQAVMSKSMASSADQELSNIEKDILPKYRKILNAPSASSSSSNWQERSPVAADDMAVDSSDEHDANNENDDSDSDIDAIVKIVLTTSESDADQATTSS